MFVLAYTECQWKDTYVLLLEYVKENIILFTVLCNIYRDNIHGNVVSPFSWIIEIFRMVEIQRQGICKIEWIECNDSLLWLILRRTFSFFWFIYLVIYPFFLFPSNSQTNVVISRNENFNLTS